AVQKLESACLHPAFHDRIHPRHLNPAEHDLDPCILEYGVEQSGVLAVAVPDQEPHPAAGVLEIHDEVPAVLAAPGCGVGRGPADGGWGGVGGPGEDAYPAGGVLDDREYELAGAA